MMLGTLGARQRREVCARLTQMESEAALSLVHTENLRAYLEGELLLPVIGKLAELLETLRQLKVCVQMSGTDGEKDDGAIGT